MSYYARKECVWGCELVPSEKQSLTDARYPNPREVVAMPLTACLSITGSREAENRQLTA